MKTVSKMSGVALASVAATLLLAGCSSGGGYSAGTAKKVADVKCSGINSCKGKSACATATSSCKGHNSCKGQGWLKEASASACVAKGGVVSGQI